MSLNCGNLSQPSLASQILILAEVCIVCILNCLFCGINELNHSRICI